MTAPVPTSLAAVILAAGASRRMGHPKALHCYPSELTTPGKLTFLEHLLSVAQHPRIGVLRVVLGAQADLIQRRVALPQGSVVLNPRWEQGQLSSLQAALATLPPGQTDGLALFLVDHPLITARLVSTLVDAFYRSGAPLVVPTYQGRRGHPVIFASRLYSELLAAPPETGARAVVWAHASEIVEVPTQERGILLNLNEPGDLPRALAGEH